jgi:hypothetical protein
MPPRTLKEAIEGRNNKGWLKAMRKELNAFVKNAVWKLVPRPKDKNVVSNKWVFKVKEGGEEKARLVAKGFTQ